MAGNGSAELAQRVARVLREDYELSDTQLRRLRSFSDINFHVQCDRGHFIVKLFDSSSGYSDACADRQFAAMLHLSERGYCCPRPVKTMSGNFVSEMVANNPADDDEDGGYRVVLLTYIHGSELIKYAPLSEDMLYKVGSFIAGLRQDMKDCDASSTSQNSWAMENFCDLKQHVHRLQDGADRELVLDVIANFERRVLPYISQLEKGLIHGDIHDENLILLSPKNTPSQTPPSHHTDPREELGLIDFGDINVSRYIFDLAISLAYFTMFSSREDFLQVGRPLLAGYTSRQAVTETERGVLYVSVCARYCQELVLSLQEGRQEEDVVYMRSGFAAGWPQLRMLWKLGEEEVLREWGALKVSA